MEHERNNGRQGKRRLHAADQEEARVWRAFYHRASNPSVAAELIAYLEQDDDLHGRHQGLYLQCRHTIRRAKRRKAIAAALGHMVAALVTSLVSLPCRWVANALGFGVDVARATAGRPVESETPTAPKRARHRKGTAPIQPSDDRKEPGAGSA